MVVGKLLERNAEADYGYNAANNTYEDLVKAGIIDPLKVCSSLPLLSCQWIHIWVLEYLSVLCCTSTCHAYGAVIHDTTFQPL